MSPRVASQAAKAQQPVAASPGPLHVDWLKGLVVTDTAVCGTDWGETELQERTVVSGEQDTVLQERTVVSGEQDTVLQERTVVSGEQDTVLQERTVVSGEHKTELQGQTVVS